MTEPEKSPTCNQLAVTYALITLELVCGNRLADLPPPVVR
jgi:hypothetical protein